MSDLEFEKSSGNVFADLGLDHADDRAAKAKLAYCINRIITSKRLSQREAARLLGIDQPKVSALKRGRLSGFSLERLCKFLVKLGHDVEIRVQPKPEGKAASTLEATVLEDQP